MKKAIAILALGVAAFVARGGDESDWRGTFTTIPPDLYSDGSRVIEGEEYILVWQKNGTTFKGFREDGSLVDNVNSIRMNEKTWRATCDDPAQGCYLDYWTITIPSSYTTTGTFSLYVLDTRRFSGHQYDADGNLLSVTTNLTVAAEGGRSIQGYAEVAALATVSTSSTLIEGTTVGKTYLLSTLDNAMIEAPVITDMRFDGDYVVLTVTSTHSKVTYDAVGSENISTAVRGAAETSSVSPVSGAATSKGTIEIRLKRDWAAKSQFFRIIRRQM